MIILQSYITLLGGMAHCAREREHIAGDSSDTQLSMFDATLFFFELEHHDSIS